MASCNMCGKEKELFKAEIEGVELQVCRECGRYGNILERVREPQTKKERIREERIKKPEVIEIIVPDYYKRIKEKREIIGLKQKDFAKAINEKESLIHNIEIGKFEPGMELAKKIGGFLKINLIKEHVEKKQDSGYKSKNNEMTLGDFIKIKKK